MDELLVVVRSMLVKGSCWYAVVISLRKLNIVKEILKTNFPWFCATVDQHTSWSIAETAKLPPEPVHNCKYIS